MLFFSTHQYPYYPGSGHWRETGRGAGAGATVNVPFPAGVGDTGYAAAFDQVLAPLARRFQPQLILVSAGYDAHWNDPLASMQLSVDRLRGPGRAAAGLAGELCDGRIVFTLEGGYHLEVLAHAVLNHPAPTQRPGEPISDPLGPCPWEERDASRAAGAGAPGPRPVGRRWLRPFGFLCANGNS